MLEPRDLDRVVEWSRSARGRLLRVDAAASAMIPSRPPRSASARSWSSERLRGMSGPPGSRRATTSGAPGSVRERVRERLLRGVGEVEDAAERHKARRRAPRRAAERPPALRRRRRRRFAGSRSGRPSARRAARTRPAARVETERLDALEREHQLEPVAFSTGSGARATAGSTSSFSRCRQNVAASLSATRGAASGEVGLDVDRADLELDAAGVELRRQCSANGFSSSRSRLQRAR